MQTSASVQATLEKAKQRTDQQAEEMASMTTAARDIPRVTSSRDNLAVVAARSVPGTVTRSHTLLTPPSSLSPALAPHGLKAHLQLQMTVAKLCPVDSDLDLHYDDQQGNGHDHRLAHGHGHGHGHDHSHFNPGLHSHPAVHPPEHESVGAITPTLLANFHLPDILLSQGPLAIRHIMGYLATSVPGFAAIPPTKARRLVVASLERRTVESSGLYGTVGQHHGDVIFEKVGWGRWDARRRGQPPRLQASPPASAASSYSSGVMPLDADRLSLKPPASLVFSNDDHVIGTAVDDTDPDRMSLDGSASASCSEAPEDDMVMKDDLADATDIEDWAAVGAAALRAASYSSRLGSSSTHLQQPSSRLPSSNSVYHSVYTLNLRSTSSGAGMVRPPQLPANFGFPLAPDEQEREAVEALLRLGAV